MADSDTARAISGAQEVWRLVPSAPHFFASSFGRVMISPTVGDMPYGGMRHYETKPTKGVWVKAEKRYIIVYRGKPYKISRLVCEAFHGQPTEVSRYCLHDDENSRNNCPDNLSWGTQKKNMNAPGYLEYCRGRVGENSSTAKGMAARARRDAQRQP